MSMGSYGNSWRHISESGSVILLWILIVKNTFQGIFQIGIMNSRSQGNFAQNISKFMLRPQHLENTYTSEILQGNTYENK